MKQTVIDIMGLSGFGALMAGSYLAFGLDITLMAGGLMLMAFSLLASSKNKVKKHA